MHKKIDDKTFEGQTFYIGIDCHKKSWKVAILGEEYEHKVFSQDPRAEVLVQYLRRNFPGGTYKSVYEAGFNGFGACRQLREQGIDAMVVHACDVPTNHKEKVQKNDKADGRKLAKCLRNRDFRGIDIPNEKIESDRALVRHRFRVRKDLTQLAIFSPSKMPKTAKIWSVQIFNCLIFNLL